MVDLGEIQAAYYMVAATGVLVAAAYYVMNMRATLQTRQAQLFMQIYQEWTELEHQKLWREVMAPDFKDFEEFVKFRSENTDWLDAYWSIGAFYEGIGALVKRGLIDVKMVDDLLSGEVIMFCARAGEGSILRFP